MYLHDIKLYVDIVHALSLSFIYNSYMWKIIVIKWSKYDWKIFANA